MGYIYQADVYCDKCGDAVRAELRAQGKAPEDELDHYSYDSDDYPKDADIEHEESDIPQHCAKCGEFMHNPLTSAGYSYVQEKLNETGLKSIYQGLMNIVLKTWASWYSFEYWTAEDCADDGRHSVAGWYSKEI